MTTTKEPGGAGVFGTALRTYLFTDNRVARMSAEQQLLFFETDRAATVGDVILPALQAGNWVVCDRGPFGSSVYQGAVQGVESDLVSTLTDWATGGMYPDLTIILDISPTVAMSRLAKRADGKNWFDTWDVSRFEQVRQAYYSIAQSASNRAVIVPADNTPEIVEHDIWSAVVQRLELERGAVNA